MADAFDELAGLYFKEQSKAGHVYKKVRACVGWGKYPGAPPRETLLCFCIFSHLFFFWQSLLGVPLSTGTWIFQLACIVSTGLQQETAREDQAIQQI